MKKAISLVSLVIVIIVMIILASTVIISSSTAVQDTNKTMFANEILNIQTLVDEYYAKNGSFPIGNSVTFNYNELESFGKSQFASESSTQFYEVALQDIGLASVEFANKDSQNDVYVLSNTTGKVYYLEGLEYDSKMYYTVSDELYNDNVLIKSNGKNEIKRYDVLFSLNEIEKTNNPVIVSVKLPKSAVINSVTTTNNKSVSSESVTGDYKIITVNETSEDKTGNYTVTVNYTYKEVTKVAKYTVTNYVSNNFSISTSESINSDIVYVTVSVTSNVANITEMKYETATITDVEYFKNYGRKVKNNMFQVDKGETYTVYVKDEAGNTKFLTKEAISE